MENQTEDNRLYDEKLKEAPYDSNLEYLTDIRYLVKSKIHLYFTFMVQELENGGYTLRDSVVYKADIERILCQGFSDYENTLYHEYQKRLWEFYEFIRYRAALSKEAGIYIPLAELIEIFELTSFEIHCLLLSLAVEIDKDFERIYSFLSDEVSVTYLTKELAVRSFCICRKEWDTYIGYFSNDNKLQDYFFISSEKNPVRSTLQSQLKIEGFWISYILKGEVNEGELQAEFFDYQAFDEPVLFHEEIDNQLNTLWGLPLIFYLYGEAGNGKSEQLKHLAKGKKKNIMFVPCGVLASISKQEARKLVAVCKATDSVLCIRDFKAAEEDATGTLFMLSEDIKYVAVLGEELYTIRNKRGEKTWYPIMVPKPDQRRRIAIFKEVMQSCGLDLEIEETSALYDFEFNYVQIQKAVRIAKAKAASLEKLTEKVLMEACYEQIEEALNNVALKLKPRYCFEDLILPRQTKDKLRLICNHIQYKHVVYKEWAFAEQWVYGKGISALFTGAPGTGKTMAARVIANELNLRIYKVDLSGLVSKYIGETEKNLEHVFNEAKSGNAILFFDEADALFGKRTEIKDSHDKHANMQTSYLLQKIEEYEGVVLLATNYAQNFDDAYKRRLKLIVDFPFPNSEYRKKIWESCFPKEAPLEENIDFNFLAHQFELAPGVIKNICLNAGIISAGRGKSIGMPEVIMALRIEMDKNNQVLLKEDLKEYYDVSV